MSNPSTLIELTQRLAQEAAVNGVAPTTTVGQSGENKRLVDWIIDAWREIQGVQRWSFLWEQVDITMLNATNVLATTIPVARWDKENTWVLPASSDNANRCLDYMEYREFSNTYRRLGNTGAITAWSIRPDNALVVNAPASGNTAINVQRWRNPQMLVNDSDVPLIPADLTMLIVYTALKKYAGYDEAGGQRTIAVDEIKTLKAALYERCLPQFSMGGSLLDNWG